MAKGKTLGEYIEKWHVKKADWKGEHELEVLGVSNVEGITTTSHVKSQDLSGYLVIEPNTFAYNPYRINVGSVGLTPNNVFGVVSPAYIVFKVREGKLIPELLLEFLKSFDGLQQINKYARGTVRKALRFDDLCKIEVNFPDYNEQKNIFEKKLIVEKKSDELETEIQTQKQLLSQLKQSILQEAIQGKLTADWREQNPNTEPSSELLIRIKAEKAKLIKDKKIKKEKVLPPITNEEIPFELPDGWVWCRLGEVGNATSYPFVDGPFGSSIDTKTDYVESGVPVLRMMNIKPFNFISTPFKYVKEEKYQKFKRHNVLPGDILFAKVGAGIGESCIVPDDFNYGMLATTGITRIRVGQIVLNTFLCYFLNFNISNFMAMARQSSQPFLNMTQVKSFLFPFPPFAEQKAIVEKVESLMQKCHALEQEIQTSESNAQMLMQAVLKEAFEGKQEVVKV